MAIFRSGHAARPQITLDHFNARPCSPLTSNNHPQTTTNNPETLTNIIATTDNVQALTGVIKTNSKLVYDAREVTVGRGNSIRQFSSWKDVEKHARLIEQRGITAVSFESPSYPEMLRQILTNAGRA